MHAQALLLAALSALGQARFGQESAVQSKIQALSSFGPPGASATLAGQTPGVLLAAANACAKVCTYLTQCRTLGAMANEFLQLQLADKIVSTLGNNPQVIAGAAALAAAEKNFNPFVQSIPTLCNDPSLPATPELRGIVPLVDPAVVGADIQNANSAKSLTAPFAGNGLSVAAISRAQGFKNFTDQAA